MTHTPGPWLAAAKPSSVVGWPIVQPATGRMICDVNYVQKNKIDPVVEGDRAFNSESAANARLIAAAPDMLKALQELDVLLDFSDEQLEGVWLFDDLDAIQNAFKQAKEILNAVMGSERGQ